MPSSLGVYIEEGLIKYAKLQKDKDSIKVEAFNIEFYDKDNLVPTLKKIVTETNSTKVPICINISNELYNYFEVFAKLEKKDIKKSVDLEFDLLCSEKGYNIKTLETRFVLMQSSENAEKYKVLYIATNKSDINNRVKLFDGYKVNSLTPMSTSITNLLEIDEKDNAIIVNIENETQITTIVEGQIYRVDMLQDGMGSILKEISKDENSVKKAYEVCKNITIYSKDSGQAEEGEYTEEITKVLRKIVTETREILESSFTNINNIYITGLGSAINNIDLYFQEYISTVKCEILKPFFAESGSIKVPIKEYIEVNSAIALALNGIGYLNKDLNFTATVALSADADVGQLLKQLFSSKGGFSLSDTPLDKTEKLLIRMVLSIIIILITYISFSKYSLNQIEKKQTEIADANLKAIMELGKIQGDIEVVKKEKEAYEFSLNSLKKLNEEMNNSESNRVIKKDAIPNFLNRLMFLIPQKVKVTSIKNTESTKISIEAEAEKYEQLGYFMAVLRTEKVLKNVQSTSGSMQDGIVKVVIEGELP